MDGDQGRAELSPQLLWVGALAVAAGAFYIPGGPVWDDHKLIVDHLATVPLSDWSALLGPVGGGEVGAGYHRPVAMVALAAVGRLGIPAVHLLATACHAVSAIFLVRLLAGTRWPLAGAALFAVHPLAGEVLGWASALPDALAMCLGLAGVVAATRERWVLAAGLTLVAVGAKETGLLLLPFAWAAGWVRVPAMLAWGAAALVAGIARLSAGVGTAWGMVDHADLAAGAVGWSLSWLAWPWPLTAVRDLHVLPVAASLLGFAALIATALLWRQRSVWAGLGLALCAPVLALPPTLHGWMAAERYLYPSLVGLALLVASVPPPARWGRPLLAVALGAGLISHAQRAPDWRANVPLFAAATQASPTSSFSWHFLGEAQRRDGDMAGCAKSFARAVELGPGHPVDRSQALACRVRAGDPAGALAWADAQGWGEVDGPTLAWWAQSAASAGELGRARSMLAQLEPLSSGWQGPEWVVDLARGLSAPGPEDAP